MNRRSILTLLGLAPAAPLLDTPTPFAPSSLGNTVNWGPITPALPDRHVDFSDVARLLTDPDARHKLFMQQRRHKRLGNLDPDLHAKKSWSDSVKYNEQLRRDIERELTRCAGDTDFVWDYVRELVHGKEAG